MLKHHVINLNNKGLTLIEIVSIIVVLAAVIIIAATITLPKMSTARDQAFRLEATKMVEASKEAIKRVEKEEINVSNNEESCHYENKYCFTVKYLSDNNLYIDNNKGYTGKIEVVTDSGKPMYILYFKKNDEFKIIGGTREHYENDKIITADMWQEEYEKCNCN